MPAEFVACAVAVPPNARAQLLRLSNQLITWHFVQILVHGHSKKTPVPGLQAGHQDSYDTEDGDEQGDLCGFRLKHGGVLSLPG
jgi:hypothetical protein